MANLVAELQESISADTQLVSKDIWDVLNDVTVAIPNWKWLALAALVIFIFVGRPLIQMLLEWAKKRPLLHRGNQFLGNFLSFNVEGPASWILTLLLSIAAVDALALTPGLDKYFGLVLKIMLAWHLIRLVYLGVDGMGQMFMRNTSRTALESQMIPFAIKTMKVFVIILGSLITLQNFGVNVMSLLAGLGIGGLALALAAQDTAANIFGSITILLDQPFKVGDWVKIGETEGKVEEVGFRSTRVRTFYNSLVTIPNAVVAKDRVDNRQARHRRRGLQLLGFSLRTPPEKIKAFCTQAEALLLKESSVDKDASVAFTNFAKNSIEIQVIFFLSQSNDAEEVAITQKIFLELMKLAGDLGIDFAEAQTTIQVERRREATQDR